MSDLCGHLHFGFLCLKTIYTLDFGGTIPSPLSHHLPTLGSLWETCVPALLAGIMTPGLGRGRENSGEAAQGLLTREAEGAAGAGTRVASAAARSHR